MAKFKTKLAIIDAVQFDGTPAGANQVFDTFDIPDARFVPWSGLSRGSLLIPTDYGEREASRGDWIIRDASGAFSVCRPDAFAARYEAITEEIRIAVLALDGTVLFTRKASDTDSDPEIKRAWNAGYKVRRADTGE